jgi:hypothetical protein
LNSLRFITLIYSIGIFGQSKIDESHYKVFQPDANSSKYNETYTQNFFFGNFGLKQLISAVPIDNSSVKSLEISVNTPTQKNLPIMQLHYDEQGKLKQMQIEEAFFGEKMNIEYHYKDELLSEEIITQNSGTKKNTFYYTKGKMVIETDKDVLDVYSLHGKVLSKMSYLDGNLVLLDRMEGKCRITYYKRHSISKTCFSNLDLKLPLNIEEYSNNEDKNGKLSLTQTKNSSLSKKSEFEYAVFINNRETYQLNLTEDYRIKTFHSLPVNPKKENQINYTFTYTYY